MALKKSEKLLRKYGEINSSSKNYLSLNNFLKERLISLPNKRYEIIIFKGAGLSQSTIKLLKNLSSRITLYLWDPSLIYPESKNIIDASDKIFTYDKYEAEKFGWIFLPLFYSPTSIKSNNHKSSTKALTKRCFFVGKLSVIRLIHSLLFVLKFNKNVVFDIILVWDINKTIQLKFLNSKIKLTNSRLSLDETYENYLKSDILLDIAEFSIGGFTTRIFDSIQFNIPFISNSFHKGWPPEIIRNIYKNNDCTGTGTCVSDTNYLTQFNIRNWFIKITKNE